ncbi:putative adhesion G protein-coupled receptor E4P, partial [Asterias rubens]|uniref:putative adhesion G protein-coupled receptor E4P n=1 Tax=Asterias rubens TaxID=7604 RepID=UPI00145594FA
SDVLAVKVLDQAETELKDFHQDPVVLGFPIYPYDASIEEASCCYFQETDSTWSDEGCSVSYKNSTFVQCSCTHLTSFAILMRPVEFELSPGDERILEILTKIGLALSITCLTATLLVYAMCRMRSLRIVIHADLAFALLAAHILFLFLDTKDEVACRCIAISLHFFLLAAFVWMFLEGAFLLIKATPTFRWKVKMPVWLSVGWGCPAVIVLISMGFNFDGYKNDQACWLSTDFNFRWAFLAPVVVIIMANTALLVKLIFIFMSLQTNKKKDEAQKMKAGLRLVLILEPMLGIPWLFGLFYQSAVFSYIFVILNTLQGVFLFVAQCLLDHEVRRKIMKFNPDKTATKVMSLTSSTSGQAGKNTGVTSSIMTSQSGAPSRLFVITNKIQKEEEVPDEKPDPELVAPDQEQLETEKQEGSVTSASSQGKMEDIDDDLKVQPERSTSFMSLSMSSGTYGDEGTSDEPEQEPVQPISLSVDSTPGTDDEEPDPENSSSSSSPSRVSTLEGTEEEPEFPGSDTAAILNKNQDRTDWKVFKEGTSSSASESKNRRKTAWSKDRSALVKIWRP